MDLYQIFITHNRLWSAREIIIFLVLLFLITGVGLGISAVIELSQLILCRGWFEWDDMIHNMLGCVCGYLIVKRLYGLKCKFEDY